MDRANALRHRITLQRPVETKDAVGAVVTTWENACDTWAAIDNLSAREMFNLSQTHATATHKVTLRFVRGVTPKWRVLFGTRVFDINAIANPEERNEQLILTVTEFL